MNVSDRTNGNMPWGVCVGLAVQPACSVSARAGQSRASLKRSKAGRRLLRNKDQLKLYRDAQHTGFKIRINLRTQFRPEPEPEPEPDVVFSHEVTLEERNRVGFANAIVVE